MKQSDELLTLQECERLTKRRVATWRKDIRLRKVPAVRLGRQVRIPREFIERLIRQGWQDPVLDGVKGIKS